MNIQLVEGEFKSGDALELITQMIHIKIKFHENKISNSEFEEDIKAREAKIKRLQKDLFDVREHIRAMSNNVHVNASIHIH